MVKTNGKKQVFDVLSLLLGVALCFLSIPAYAANVDEQTAIVDETIDAEYDANSGSSDEYENLEGVFDTSSNGEEESGCSETQPLDTDLEPPGQDGEGDLADNENAGVVDVPEQDSAVTRHPTPLAAGYYAVMPSSSSSRVLDITSNSGADGANVQLWSSNMSSAQIFEVLYDGEGFYTFRNSGSSKFLDVAWGSKNPGSNVHQYAVNASEAQKWIVIENADGSFTIESALREGLVLDISAALDSNGANVQVWTSNGSLAQRFRFLNAAPSVEGGRTVADGVYMIKGVASGKVLDVSGASQGDGAQVQLYTPNGTFAQMFHVTLGADGFYTLRAVHSGKALDASSGSIVPGAKVQQWSFSASNANQKWAISDSGSNGYVLTSKANGQVLDARWGGVSDGTPLQTYTPNSSDAQYWALEPVTSLLSEGYYALKSGQSGGRVVDVVSGSSASGANVQTWTWNDTPAQRWKLSEVSSGLFVLESLCSGLLLTQIGSNVIQATVDVADPDSQRWVAVPAQSGGVSFVNERSGLVLDVSGAGDWDGCNIGAYPSNGTRAQSFFPQSVGVVGKGAYLLRSKSDGRVLDVASGSRSNGANVQIWAANGSGAQAWNIDDIGGGLFSIKNAQSKKGLDIAEHGVSSGCNVQQWDYAGGLNQKWGIAYVGGGYYTFTSAAANLCLDISGGGGRDGANAQVHTPNGSEAQLFRLEPTTFVAPASGAVKRSNGSWDWCNGEGYVDRNGAIDRVITTARSLLGVPYVWLGVYPQDGGMDCASFTWYLYRQLGIEIGFETYDQMYSGYRVGSLNEAKPGDIVLMYYGAWPNYNPFLPEHVALYAGNGMIYEEPTFGGYCQFVPLASKGAGKMEIRRIISD